MPKLLDVVRDFSKRGIDLRFSFLFGLLPFPCWDSLGADGRLRKQEKDAAVGLLLRVFLHLFAVHRQLTATQAVKSTPARHKVNCPKGKRGSPGGHPCRATFLRVITDSSYRLHLSIGFYRRVRQGELRQRRKRRCPGVRPRRTVCKPSAHA